MNPISEKIETFLKEGVPGWLVKDMEDHPERMTPKADSYEHPVKLHAGQTYKTKDGGEVTVRHISVDSFHKDQPEILVHHDWKSPSGKTGKGVDSIGNFKTSYFK